MQGERSDCPEADALAQRVAPGGGSGGSEALRFRVADIPPQLHKKETAPAVPNESATDEQSRGHQLIGVTASLSQVESGAGTRPDRCGTKRKSRVAARSYVTTLRAMINGSALVVTKLQFVGRRDRSLSKAPENLEGICGLDALTNDFLPNIRTVRRRQARQEEWPEIRRSVFFVAPRKIRKRRQFQAGGELWRVGEDELGSFLT